MFFNDCGVKRRIVLACPFPFVSAMVCCSSDARAGKEVEIYGEILPRRDYVCRIGSSEAELSSEKSRLDVLLVPSENNGLEGA